MNFFCRFIFLFLVFSPLLPAGISYGAVDEEKIITEYLWHEVLTLPKDKRPKIGIALGGGGARGYAHIGVLRVLEEENFPIDMLSGTSVGALVGALYSGGVSLDDIEKMAEGVGWVDLTDLSTVSLIRLLLKEKLLSTEKMEKYIAKNIGGKQFYELKIPFACVATDLKTGEKIVFREGDVALAVRASANIPGIFSPVEDRHRLLVDGGLVDNIPADLVKFLGADVIIAVDISSDFTKYAASSVLSVLTQSISIQGDLLSEQETKYADMVINPRVSDVDAYELWRYQECIDSGVVECRKMLPAMKQIVINRTFKWMLWSKD